MTKYIAAIDYKASYKSGFDFVELESKNIVDAMEEANKRIDMENVYMVSVAEKFGNIERPNKGEKIINYKMKVEKRSFGWDKAQDYGTKIQKQEVSKKGFHYVNYQFVLE